MSAQDVEKEILEPMQRLFLSPRQMDSGQQAAALREYVAALEWFEAIDLKTAWTAVRDSHATRAWPVPAAFVQAARVARKDRVGDRPRTKKTATAAETWQRWTALRHGEKAREAAKRGVAWAFKLAILEGKFPDAINLTELERAKESAESTAARIENGEDHEWNGRRFVFSEENVGPALKMWRNIQIKNAETEQEILGSRRSAA